MQVVYHIGAHETGGDRLVLSLRRDAERLAERGVVVPKPVTYRKMMRDAVNTLRGRSASPETAAALLSVMHEGPAPERLVLSNESFLCVPDRVLDDGLLYGRAFKAAWLAGVFPGARPIFALSLRNPATLIPALYRRRQQRALDFEEYTLGINPERLRWSETVQRIRANCPGAEVIAWCDEDTPLIWAEVLAALAGQPAPEEMAGGFDRAEALLAREDRAGLREAAGRLAGPARRAAIGAYLEAHLDPGALEEELDTPGWDADAIDAMTQAYDEDVAALAAIEGVTVIAP